MKKLLNYLVILLVSCTTTNMINAMNEQTTPIPDLAHYHHALEHQGVMDDPEEDILTKQVCDDEERSILDKKLSKLSLQDRREEDPYGLILHKNDFFIAESSFDVNNNEVATTITRTSSSKKIIQKQTWCSKFLCGCCCGDNPEEANPLLDALPKQISSVKNLTCKNFTKEDVLIIASHCSALEILTLNNCNLDGEIINLLALHLPELFIINFDSCRINAYGFPQEPLLFENLLKATFSNCIIKQKSILTKFAQMSPALQFLSLQGPTITGDDLCGFGEVCKKLTHLTLKSPLIIGQELIFYLSKAGFKRLTHLNIASIGKVTHANILSISLNLRETLKELLVHENIFMDKDSCPLITTLSKYDSPIKFVNPKQK